MVTRCAATLSATTYLRRSDASASARQAGTSPGRRPPPAGRPAPEIAYDFAYNGVGQLVTQGLNDPLLKWSPTANQTDDYTVNGLNQYAAVNGVAPAYDMNGNLTADGAGRSFAYDAENVLRAASGLANGTATYAYDAAGNRRRKAYNATVSDFYYDGDQEILETDGTGAVLRRYLRLPGSVDEPILMIDYTLDAGCTTAANGAAACERWAHQNRLGSVVTVTNSSGAVVERHTYGPYGELGTEPANGFPFRFTGQKLDPETGLYYYKARFYDPETGRFLQTDPIGYRDQMNLYAYVGNDPVNLTDPTGEFAPLLAAVGCGANPVCRGAAAGALGFGVGAAVNAAVQFAKTGQVNLGDALTAGAAAGAASAAVAVNPALASNPATLAAIGVVLGASGSVAGDVVNGRDINVPNAAVAGVAGAVSLPGGVKIGDIVETAFGASAKSFVGEIGGAALGEATAGAINAATSGPPPAPLPPKEPPDIRSAFRDPCESRQGSLNCQ